MYEQNVFSDILENFEALGDEAMERPPAQPPMRSGGLSQAPPPTPMQEAGEGFDWARFGGDMLNRLGSGILIGGGNQAAGIAKRQNFLQARAYEDQLAAQQQEQEDMIRMLQGVEGEIGSQQWINGAAKRLMGMGHMKPALSLLRSEVNAKDFTLGKDDIRFDAQGNEIARGLPSPEDDGSWAIKEINGQQYRVNATTGESHLMEGLPAEAETPGGYEAEDFQIVVGRDGARYRVNKLTNQMEPVGGAPDAPEFDPAKIRPENDAFLKRSAAARTLIQQTDRVLSSIDLALKDGNMLAAATALKAYVQSIDDSVVREAELQGAKDAMGLRQSLLERWNVLQGNITPENLKTLRAAAVALGATALPAMDQSEATYRSLYGRSPNYAPFLDEIVAYPEKAAYEKIKQGLLPSKIEVESQPKANWADPRPAPQALGPQGNATQGVHEGATVHPSLQKTAPTMDGSADPEAEGRNLMGGSQPLSPGTDLGGGFTLKGVR